MQRNVCITGGNGYLGGIVTRRLHQEMLAGHIDNLLIIDIKPPAQPLLGVYYEQSDVRDTAISELFEKYNIDTVVHLAAVMDSQSLPRKVQYEIDVLGTENILRACVTVGAKRFISTSSGAAYGYHADNPDWLRESDNLRGNQLFPYSHHKRLVEELLAKYRKDAPQLEQTIFRVGTILGKSTNNLITNLFEKRVVLGVRGFASPFVFIWDEDAANCIKTAVFAEKTGVYNLVGDGAIPNAELAKLLDKKYLALPAKLLKNALRFLRTMKITRYGASQLLFLQYRPVLDNTKLKSEFGFTPAKTSLQTFLYFLEHRGWKARDKNDIKILYPS